MKDTDEGYPSDSNPHTNEYDYLPDNGLEDGTCCFGEDESVNIGPLQIPRDSDSPSPSPQKIGKYL